MKHKVNKFIKEIKKRKKAKRFFQQFSGSAWREMFAGYLKGRKKLNRKRKKFFALEKIPFGRAVVMDKNGVKIHDYSYRPWIKEYWDNNKITITIQSDLVAGGLTVV